jgi:hypothetical protein
VRCSRSVWSLFTLKKNRFFAQVLSGLLLATAVLALSSCARILYHVPQNQFGGRTIPPSQLLQRVLVTYTSNGTGGGAVMLDGLRDLRMNIQDTIPSFPIQGFSEALPATIFNFPEQQIGYVLNSTDGTLESINYGTEKVGSTVATFGAYSPSVAAAYDGSRFVGAVNGQGILEISSGSGVFSLNLPNVDKVAINQGNSIILAMVRNSNSLYRVIRMPQTSAPVMPANAIDCQPLLLPVYCVVPVAGTYDRPNNVAFSEDGTTAYVLNCGPECGGAKSSITFLNESALQVDNLNTTASAVQTLPVANPVLIPGGATIALADASNLYISGQSLGTDGFMAGNLTLLSLATDKITSTYSISDGTHTKMLFADDNTLWIGSQGCASGERAHQAALGNKTQAANYNCLSRFVIQASGAALCNGSNPVFPLWSAKTAYATGAEICESNTAHVVTVAGTSGSAPPQWNPAIDALTTDAGVQWASVGPITSPVQIVPAITPNSTVANILYLNTNANPIFYGDLNGLCWVQTFHKIYTGYGGQIHAFNTIDGSERNNFYITVQGNVLDVAYMDALTNSAN